MCRVTARAISYREVIGAIDIAFDAIRSRLVSRAAPSRSTTPSRRLLFLPFSLFRSAENRIDRPFRLLFFFIERVTWSDPLRVARHSRERGLSRVSSLVVLVSLDSAPRRASPLAVSPFFQPVSKAPVVEMPYRGKFRLLGRACVALGNACGKSDSSACFAVASIAGSRNFSVGRALDMR